MKKLYYIPFIGFIVSLLILPILDDNIGVILLGFFWYLIAAPFWYNHGLGTSLIKAGNIIFYISLFSIILITIILYKLNMKAIKNRGKDNHDNTI